MLLFLLSGLAMGQDFGFGQSPELNAQVFRPSLDQQYMWWSDDSSMLDENGFTGGGVLQYLHKPLVYENGAGEQTNLLGGVAQLDLMGTYTLGKLRFGADVPVLLRAFSDNGNASGLGDLALEGKYGVLDRDESAVGLAVSGRLTLPTATVDLPLGAGGLGGELQVAVDRAINDQILVLGNAGIRFQPNVELENVKWGDQLMLRAGGAYMLNKNTSASLELANQFGIGENSNKASRPLEAIAGVRHHVKSGLVFRGGLGAGLTSAVGSPRVRVLLGVGYAPFPPPPDTDGDGFRDDVDACINEPEDVDNYEDSDGCPEPTVVNVDVFTATGEPAPKPQWTLNGVQGPVEAGTWPLVTSAEGWAVVEQEVEIPAGPPVTIRVDLERLIDEPVVVPGKLQVKVMDADGNPIEGATWRAVGTKKKGNAGTEGALDPGEYKIELKAPEFGAKTVDVVMVSGEATVIEIKLKPAKTVKVRELIELKDLVYFETNLATLKVESHTLLDGVAKTLIEHPELLLVRVEGHTDDRGDAAFNKDLSQRRAEEVVNYLVNKGVERSRLEAEGFGEEKPLVEGTTDEARSQNRRVDFYVVKRSD